MVNVAPINGERGTYSIRNCGPGTYSGSGLTVVDGVGHYRMLEAPERWIEALLGLLAQ